MAFAPTLLLALHLLAPGDPESPALRPGDVARLTARARVVLASAGEVTLARHPGGSLRVTLDGAADPLVGPEGWLTAEFPAGEHVVEAPGAATLVVLPGAVPRPVAPVHELLNTALALHGQQQLEAARDAFLQALVVPADERHHAIALAWLADLLRLQGRLADAEDLLAPSCLALLDELPAKDFLVFALVSAGRIALDRDDPARARVHLERARELAPSAGTRALATSHLAAVAAREGDVDGAQRLHEEALQDARDEPAEAREVTFRLARFLAARGELVRAGELLQGLARDDAPPLTRASALAQLATVRLQQGRHDEAADCLSQLAASARADAPAPLRRGLLRNEGALAFELGDYARARACFEQLLPGAGEGDERASLLADLATVSWHQDDEETARELYEAALAATRGPGDVRWRALACLAALQFRAGRTDEMAATAASALALARALGNPVAEAVSLMSAATVELLAARPHAAAASADTALAALGQAQVGGHLELSALHVRALAALALDDLQTVDALLARASSLVDGLSRERPPLAAARLRSRASELAEWGRVAQDLSVRRALADGAERATELAAGLSRAAEWKGRGLLGQARPGGHDLVERLLAALPPRTALVEYVDGVSRTSAYVLADGTLRLVDLGPSAPLAAAAEDFLAVVSDASRLGDVATVAARGQALHDLLLAPLAPLPEHLVIVPTTALARLPFEAVVVSAPQAPSDFDDLRFVLDEATVRYAPSTLALLRAPSRQPAAAGSIVLLGDPLFGDDLPLPAPLLAARDTEPPSPRLVHTRTEVLSLARLVLLLERGPELPDHLLALAELELQRSGAFDARGVHVRLGADATVDAVAQLAPTARVLHLATHGRLDRWHPERTGLLLSADEGGDELLGLTEIAALPLAAELVVLSACDSADGRALHGEGLQSMAQAFLQAGVRSVVASLWRVGDPEAGRVIERFMRGRLAGGESCAVALRQAKRELRAAGDGRGLPVRTPAPAGASGHPHVWAPFVLLGEL